MSLKDEIQKILNVINDLISKKCVCFTKDEYDQLIKELDDIINKLESWLKDAEAGTIGVKISEKENR